MSVTLFKLTDSYIQLQRMIEDSETPTEALLDTFEAIKDELPIKVENTGKVIRWSKLNLEAIKAEIDRLNRLYRSAESKVEWLENNLITNMGLLDLQEVKTSTMTINLVNNPPAVDITDRTKIPHRFIKRTITENVDKNAIKEAIKNGEEVPGATLKQGKRLNIK